MLQAIKLVKLGFAKYQCGKNKDFLEEYSPMASRAAASPPLPTTASPGVSRLLQIATATAEMGSLTGTENAGEN